MFVYKVLLVDDERIILEGISRIVDWNGCGTRLAATARNGLEAKAWAEQERPDIVITDIKMPGMDGLQLVQHLYEMDPSIRFIMLSGFSDFNYARTAMQLGVRHYLLKPCNERAIMEALNELVGELNQRLSREQFLQTMEQELKKVKPHAREQFLRELVTNKTYGREEWEDFSRLLGIATGSGEVRLLLLLAEGVCEYEQLFALKNIAEELLARRLLLSAIVGKQVLLLIREASEPELLLALIHQIRRIFTAYYKIKAAATLSDPGDITAVRQLYRDTLECLSFRFYLGEDSLITRKDIAAASRPQAEPALPDEESVCLAVKSGQWQEAKAGLDLYFEALSQPYLATALVKSYLVPLYVGIVRAGGPEKVGGYLQELAKWDELDTMQAMRDFIVATARQICLANEAFYQHARSDIIAKVIRCIEVNLADQRLSLLWVAGDMLYMNADYLGKLFKKETGEKFSHYVTRLRMERAIAMIDRMDDVKVFELADRLGFGDNPQYFSQVFKKHTGYSPSEFKRTL